MSGAGNPHPCGSTRQPQCITETARVRTERDDALAEVERLKAELFAAQQAALGEGVEVGRLRGELATATTNHERHVADLLRQRDAAYEAGLVDGRAEERAAVVAHAESERDRYFEMRAGWAGSSSDACAVLATQYKDGDHVPAKDGPE